MERNVAMKALMSLPAIEGREAVKRGDPYQATEQEALDDERFQRGKRVAAEDKAAPEAPKKAKG